MKSCRRGNIVALVHDGFDLKNSTVYFTLMKCLPVIQNQYLVNFVASALRAGVGSYKRERDEELQG